MYMYNTHMYSICIENGHRTIFIPYTKYGKLLYMICVTSKQSSQSLPDQIHKSLPLEALQNSTNDYDSILCRVWKLFEINIIIFYHICTCMYTVHYQPACIGVTTPFCLLLAHADTHNCNPSSSLLAGLRWVHSSLLGQWAPRLVGW